MASGIASYRRAQQDVAPEQLVTLLFRTALARLKRLEGLTEPDDRWVNDVHHVRCILIELRDALDPEVDEALTKRLSDLYGWCLLQLISAGTDRRTELIRPVRQVLDELHEGWVAAVSSGGAPEPEAA